MYQAYDPERLDGLKKTSLSVLEQKKQHKTNMQKTFQQFNQQRPRESAYQHQMGSRPTVQQHHFGSQDSFRAPRHQSIQSNTSSFTSQMPPPPAFFGGSHPQSMSPNGPLLQQGHWSGKDDTGYSGPLSGFKANGSESASSPALSQDGWSNGVDAFEVQAQLDRLALLEAENLQLREMNKQLREDNGMLLAHIQEDPSKLSIQKLETQLELKEDELRKKIHVTAELEAQVADMTQNMTKLKLVSKTAQDKKDKEIAGLKEDIDTLEKELDAMFNRNASTTRDTSPMASPQTKEGAETPPISAVAAFSSPYQGKKGVKEQGMRDELVQDLLMTIRSLRIDYEMLRSEKTQLAKSGERDKRVLKLLANAKNHKVKMRRGLTLVSHVDTLI